jgi:hypothetical protein
VKYLKEEMGVLEWLERSAPGFADLSADERNRVMHFCLLWSLFEGEVLAFSCSVDSIEQAVQRWKQGGALMTSMFESELEYFRDRYFQNGAPTYRFQHLHLEKSRNPQVVPDVLGRRVDDPDRVAVALLIIVFRYRNNLFHGEKWTYELRDQDQNFAHANAILMRAIELNRALGRAGSP